jgi:hypothetical protein
MADTTHITKAGITSERSQESERFEAKRLLWAGPLTALVAAVGTVLVREIGVLAGAIRADIQVLQEPAVAFSTIGFVLLGTLVFAAIIRFARRPARTFRVVAVAALVLSMFNPIAAGAGWVPLGVSLGFPEVVSMMLMHVVAGVSTIYLLPTLARER